jgi:hypothetical protein
MADKSDLLTTAELADRWKMAKITLQNWRQKRKGPSYIKMGRQVLYRVADVEAYERDNISVVGEVL